MKQQRAKRAQQAESRVAEEDGYSDGGSEEDNEASGFRGNLATTGSMRSVSAKPSKVSAWLNILMLSNLLIGNILQSSGGVRTEYDWMFERKNQNILSELYTKLIDHQPIQVALFLIPKTLSHSNVPTTMLTKSGKWPGGCGDFRR